MIRKTRVTQNVGNPGTWVAQLWYPDMGLWCDIGDSHATRTEAAQYLDEHERSLIHSQIPVIEADSVTHFICPKGPTEDGRPVATHHLIPRAAGKGSYQQVCTYCGGTESALRTDLRL